MLSRSLGQDPDNQAYMEVLSGMEDCPCEAFQIATEEDLVVRERVPIRNERPSVREPGTNGNHAPIGQITERRSRSQWTMCVQTGIKTNLLHPNKGCFGED